jgi:CubicO group peptidase (beta-lactamase class C family)
MRSIFLILAGCTLTVGALVARLAGQPPAADARFDALASLTEAKMREYGVPGVALGIVNGGAVTVRGFGVTSVEFPQPIGEHTVFPIASISKTFAATVAMRLVEQGKLDLKEPVRKYIPEFRVQDEAASRDATIWHLLTHTPGWEGQVSGPDRGSETVSHFLITITDLMQLAPPGAAWSYNNAGFSILGRVFEVVAGQPLNRVIRE